MGQIYQGSSRELCLLRLPSCKVIRVLRLRDASNFDSTHPTPRARSPRRAAAMPRKAGESRFKRGKPMGPILALSRSQSGHFPSPLSSLSALSHS